MPPAGARAPRRSTLPPAGAVLFGSMLYRSVLRPLLFTLPPETAHEIVLRSCSVALRPAFLQRIVRGHYATDPFAGLNRFGLSFRNPVGLAAGFDKNARAAHALSALGFGFIEVGTVTHERQPGNPRPRIFRLPRDRALINRAGFNNDGARAAAERLRAERPFDDVVIGVNIGKSRSAPIEAAVSDYIKSFDEVRDVADYVVVNVSSPNTPGLRELQRAAPLRELLAALQERNQSFSTPARPAVPLLVKIAPELTAPEIEAIVEVARQTAIAGIIAVNTTTRRDGLRTPAQQVAACGDGGLSGRPLSALATTVISQLYRLTEGKIKIIGVGGIFSAEDAWEKICAGASLVQLYTGFIYEGPGIARRINEQLRVIMERQGFSSLDDAVGSLAGVARS